MNATACALCGWGLHRHHQYVRHSPLIHKQDTPICMTCVLPMHRGQWSGETLLQFRSCSIFFQPQVWPHKAKKRASSTKSISGRNKDFEKSHQKVRPKVRQNLCHTMSVRHLFCPSSYLLQMWSSSTGSVQLRMFYLACCEQRASLKDSQHLIRDSTADPLRHPLRSQRIAQQTHYDAH